METIPNSWHAPAPLRAAFFDIDGTLSHLGSFEILPSAAEALRLLRRAGVRCFVASGRGPADLAEFPVELFDGFAMFNGQYCVVDGELVHTVRFSEESLDAIRALASRTGRTMTAQGISGLFSLHRTEPFFRVYKVAVERFPLTPIDKIAWGDIFQSSIECALGEEEALAAQLPGCEIARWNPSFVDIIPAGGGKGRGVSAMLAQIGMAREEAVAFGDSDNDIPMLEACGTGIAVGGATPRVKAAAAYVTDDIEDEGIYRACVRLGLIRGARA